MGLDLAPRGCVGRRGECDPWDRGVARLEDVELPIFRTKVVAPLAHAVGLVDREKSELRLIEALEKRFGREPLGCDIDEIETSGDHAGFALARRLIGKRRIDERSSQTDLMERRDLILHESYQRRDDDGDAVPHECRDLVTEALSAARGHEH